MEFSEGYYKRIILDLNNLKSMIENNIYKSEYRLISDAVDSKINLCNDIIKEKSCHNCQKFINAVEKGYQPTCQVYGVFPETIDINKYSCNNWLYDDIPF